MPSRKPLPWSHSALGDFLNCPKQYFHKRVAKDVQDTQGEAALWGDQVHKFFEASILAFRGQHPEAEEIWATLRLQGMDPDESFKAYTPYLESVLAIPRDDILPERQYAIGKDLKPCDWFSADVWCRGIIDVLILKGDKAYALDWKGLDVRTPLPTPTGWTTMGEVQVGDVLFSEDGEQCIVTGKSKVKNLPCFRVDFDDKTSAVCDHEHLWKLHDGAVVPVTELVVGDRINVAAPLALPDVPLPIDPYVLGLWLADGKRTSGEVTKPDSFVWEEVARRGYATSHDYSERAEGGKCTVRTIYGLRTALRALGILGTKRIPEAYLRAGYQQRLDLLRGLMDGDGNANPARKQCVFTTTNRGLSVQVQELLLSLGQRPLMSVVQAKGFGLTIDAYPLSFRPIGINPFLLPRKADRVLPSWGPGNSWRRKVVGVTEVDSVPTQCIAVSSADHTFLCGEHMVPTHNTGKRKVGSKQLKLFALMVFLHHPEVMSVKTGFVWLKEGVSDYETYTRDQEADLWQEFVGDLARYNAAFKQDMWIPRKSGLCRGWCPVTSCEFWEPKKLVK